MSEKKKQTRKNTGENQNRRGWTKTAMIVVVVMIVIVGTAIAVYHMSKGETDGTEDKTVETNLADTEQETESSSAQEETEPQVVGLTFPYELENGKLSVDSIFQFTGFNPDNQEQEGENIAALTVVNQSEEQVAFAEIQVRLDDDTRLTFEITDLPAGQSVMVFEKENKNYELDDVCLEITDTAEFENGTMLMEDYISVAEEGTVITLTNHSEENFSNLLLHCHCRINGVYFGGLTYSYPIAELPAGQSITVDATDCYLGEAAVVRVSPGQ